MNFCLIWHHGGSIIHGKILLGQAELTALTFTSSADPGLLQGIPWEF